MDTRSTTGQERYVLFAEEQSRYDNRLGHALPSELPDDGLKRVVVDHSHAARVSPEELSLARTDATRRTFLLRDSPLRRYTRTIGLSAQRLAETASQPVRLWCVGEMSRAFAQVLPGISGVEMTVLRTGIIASVVAFCVSPETIEPETVWPFFANDDGARIFAFDRTGTELEARFTRLLQAMQENAPTVAEEWRRGDWERTVQRALTDRSESLVYEEADETPPSARDVVRLWRDLCDDCWERGRLRSLMKDALFCVLPDGMHNGTVSFHSAHLGSEPIVEAIASTVREQGGSCSVVAFVDERR